MLWQFDRVMTIFNALIITAFLILLAASAVVVGSMIVLKLFDFAFGKKIAPPAASETTESDQLNESPSEPEIEVVEPKAVESKPKPLAA